MAHSPSTSGGGGGPADIDSIIKCTLDFSSLTALLQGFQASQAALLGRVTALESDARVANLQARAGAADVASLQQAVAAQEAASGETRLALGRLRAAQEDIPQDLLRVQDVPCSRAEWEALKAQVAELRMANGNAAAEQGSRPLTSAVSAEVATLKAEVAELSLAQTQMAQAVKDLTKLVVARDGGAGAGTPRAAGGVVPGESAKAFLDLLHRKSPTPTPLLETDSSAATPRHAPSPVPAAVSEGTAVVHIATALRSDEALAAQVAQLTSTVHALQTELSVVRSSSQSLQSDLSSLRSGLKDIHASMPVPFVAPVEAAHPAPIAALQPTMIAVSLLCDGCSVNTACVFCVHCAAGSQKLCESCDATVHALVPAEEPADLPRRAPRRASGSIMHVPAESPVTRSADASKHLRLDISKTISPGSKLMSSDLSFIRGQGESQTHLQLVEAQARSQKAADELAARVDRHDLQFAALAISLNALDEAGANIAALDREVKQIRTRAADAERAAKQHVEDYHQLAERVEVVAKAAQARAAMGAHGAGGGHAPVHATAAPPVAASTLLGTAQTPSTEPATASLARQLHTELDAHRRQTNHAFLELVAKLDSFQSVQIDAQTDKLRALERTKVDAKQLLALSERVIACESALRSLGNTQTFAGRKAAEHQQAWTDALQAWTCQHCDTNALACTGPCAADGCKRRICWECSRVGVRTRTGHVSEAYARSSSVGATGGAGVGAGATTSLAVQAQLEGSPVVRELQTRVHSLVGEQDKALAVAKRQQTALQQLLDMMAQLNLIVPNQLPGGAIAPANSPPLKFGTSAALLLDPRTLGFYEALGELFSASLPQMLQRLSLADHRASVMSESLAALERRNREFDVASRPFVEERLGALQSQLAVVEKAAAKRLRTDLKRFEVEFHAKLRAEQKEEKEKMGLETSIARVHFRCVACDQPVAAQPGPLSREFQQQLAAHMAQVHGITSPQPPQPQPPQSQQSLVAGFASPVSLGHSSSLSHGPLSGPGGLAAASSTPTAVVSLERGHMFIGLGARTTLHSTVPGDSSVFRGREETRLSFTPAAPTLAADHRQSASFQTAYSKAVITPAGAVGRSAGGARAHARARTSSTGNSPARPQPPSQPQSFQPSASQPLGSTLPLIGSLSARGSGSSQQSSVAGSQTARSSSVVSEESKLGD